MRTLSNIVICFLILLIITISCDTSKRPNSEGLQDELASREVKKVTDAEIMIRGEELGLTLLDTVEKTFKKELMGAMKREGVAGAIRYCNLNAYGLVSGYEDSLGVVIRRVTNKVRNVADSLNEEESAIFEAYQFDPELATTQIQQLNDQSLILTRPIKISNGVCLNCHGTVGNEVSEENYQLIKSLYPADEAINYKVGDLRGMWSIHIPKKTVVNQL